MGSVPLERVSLELWGGGLIILVAGNGCQGYPKEKGRNCHDNKEDCQTIEKCSREPHRMSEADVKSPFIGK